MLTCCTWLWYLSLYFHYVSQYLAKKLGFDTLWFGYLQTTVGLIQLIGGPMFGRSVQSNVSAAWRLSLIHHRSCCFNISENKRVDSVFCRCRFGDVFGARAALSLACSATVVFFLLLAIAENPAMLFIHKIPTVFMHVLPGEFNILNSKQDQYLGSNHSLLLIYLS